MFRRRFPDEDGGDLSALRLSDFASSDSAERRSGGSSGVCVRFGGVVSNDRAYWRTLSCKDCDAEMGDGGVSSRSEGELFQRKFLQRQGHFDPQIVPLYKEEITRQKSLRKH